MFLLLTVRLFHALSRSVGKGRTRSVGDDSLIFRQGQIAFLQDVVHLSGAQVGSLQRFLIGLACLADQLVGCGRSAEILLATQQIPQTEGGYLVMQAAITAIFSCLPDLTVDLGCLLIAASSPL